MKWITAADIKNWVSTKSRHCQQTMPELLRRLILATAQSVQKIDFPCDESVTTGGWDGILETTSSSPFFPEGVSGWEIGVESSSGTKAEGDYKKRTDDSLGLVKSESTFVFVTPRVWPGRSKWENGKVAEEKWKTVRVIAADDLELWLASAPAVALWLARQIGKVTSANIRDLEAVWEEWSEGTEPKMTADLVVSGRTENAEAIHQWLDKEADILEVQGDSPDEALAFLYAAITTLSEEQQVKALARCVVVQNISEFRQLVQAYKDSPLIIAAPGECAEAAPLAKSRGHHVYICMDAKTIGMRDVLSLARPQRKIVEKSLRDGGLTEGEAEKIARDSGRSIPVLRRQLFRSAAVSAPAWANPESAKILIPFLFAGAWDEQKEDDREVIEMLSGMSHEAFINALTPLLSADDSPIRKVGTVWMLKSPLDAWFLLSRHLTDGALKLLEKAVLAVLTKTDPKYDLKPEQRWAAAVYGKASPYSEWLRTGLVESLVLIAVYGNRSPHISSTQTYVDHVVRAVFATADKWEAWSSIKDVTPLLAEAAPDSFLEVVEQHLEKDATLFTELMQDEGGLFGECRHSGLLWGLENITWNPEYFGRAVNVLFALAKIDKGGAWSNRAANSLSDIFHPGFPQTYAAPEERLAALDILIKKDSQLVWKFTQQYLVPGSISESHRFRWRDSGGIRKGLEHEDIESHGKYLAGLLPKLGDLACAKENLVSSTGDLIRLPEFIREQLLLALESTDILSLPDEVQRGIFQGVREALHWINNYGGEEEQKNLAALNRIMGKFTPTDTLARVGWLLSDPWPQLPEGKLEDHEENEAAVVEAREKAAREVLDKESIDRIIEFGGTVQYVGVLGHALGKVIRDEEEDSKILEALIERSMNNPLLIRFYAQGRVETTGPDWINKQIDRLKAKGNYSPQVGALLYLGLTEGADTWAAVSSQGKEVESEYWKQASGRSRGSKNDEAPLAIEKLLDAKRPAAALEIAGHPKVSIPSALLERLLLELLNIEDKKFRGGGMDGYHLGHVFRQLYERNELPIEKIAGLEWPFAAFFEELKRTTTGPMALHRLLQQDASFFSQLITFISRGDEPSDSNSEEIDEEKAIARARVTGKVLDSWTLMPGMKEDRTLNEQELSEWIDQARRKCSETKHVTGCDLQIAKILARSPVDPDGAWPHVAVRNLVESLNSKLIDDHIAVALYNSRGVTSKGIFDGGEQERVLAEKYKAMSDVVRTKWPRTGALLRSIARHYESMAKHEDIDSDLRELRWD